MKLNKFIWVISILLFGLSEYVEAVTNPIPIQWTNLVGVSNTVSRQEGVELVRTASGSGWNAGASSLNLLPANINGLVQFTLPQVGSKLAFGLTKQFINQNFTTIQYAIVLESNNTIDIYVYGTKIGSYGKCAVNDLFIITRIGAVITFYRNGNILTNIQGTANEPLIAICDFATSGGAIRNPQASFYQPLTLSASITNMHCTGLNTGEVDLTASGGVPPYNYTWSNGATTSSILNVNSGTFSVTVTDNAQNSKTGNYFVANCVEWIDSAGLSIQGNTITKTAPKGWGNAGAASANILLANHNGWVQMPVADVTDQTALGLTSINTSTNYSTFDFAFLIKAKKLYIYDRGVVQGDFGKVLIADTLKIQRTGDTMLFIRNSKIIYRSIAPAHNSIVAAAYTGDLVAVVSLYQTGSIISNVTCSFSNVMIVTANVIDEYSPDSLGSITLSIRGGEPPYQVIWNGNQYDSRSQFKAYIDSIAKVDSLGIDTNVFHLEDSLRQNLQQVNVPSGIYTAMVIDSVNDTVILEPKVGVTITWFNNYGVSFNVAKLPSYLARNIRDSIHRLMPGANIPTQMHPIRVGLGQGNNIIKTAPSGWNSGEATTFNNFPSTKYCGVTFTVTDVAATQAAGFKVDSVPDQQGYSDIKYGFYFSNGSLSIINNGVITPAGTYRSGDMFAIENAYDSIPGNEYILLEQNGTVLSTITANPYILVNPFGFLNPILLNNTGTNQPNSGVQAFMVAPAQSAQAASPTQALSNTGLAGLAGSTLPFAPGNTGIFPFPLNTGNIVTPTINYLFKGAIYTTGGSFNNLSLADDPVIPSNVIITEPTCALPNSGAVAVTLSTVAGVKITSAVWSNGQTGTTLTGVPAGLYTLTINYTLAPSSSGVLHLTYRVSEKVYWDNLTSATPFPAPGSQNSIFQLSFPPFIVNYPSGGNSDNILPIAEHNAWIEFQAPAGGFLNQVACGYADVNNPSLVTPNKIAYGVLVTQKMKPPKFTQNIFTAIVGGVITGVKYISLSSAVSTYNNTVRIDRVPCTGGVRYNYYVNNGLFAKTPTSPYACIFVGNVYNVKGILAPSPPSGPTVIINPVCSFGCSNNAVQYATLTKELDGSYYVAPYSRLSFRYDEEYVTNSSSVGLTYKIYDKNNNVLLSNTSPGSPPILPDNYKDNYYTIDLTAANPTIYKDFYVLEVTNQKGEKTYLRFKD